MTASPALEEIALFPIPEMVCFPDTTVPLHVFEPRYRALVRDCVRDERLIAVCHTVRQISENKVKQSVSDTLRSNQASFEPQRIFSAGSCTVVETTDDGRLRVDIKMLDRYQMVEELQSVPYRIAACKKIPDEELKEQQQKRASVLMHETHNILENILARQFSEVDEKVDLSAWLELSPAAYSFQLFSMFRFDGDFMQSILETTNPLKRLQRISHLFAEDPNPNNSN